MFTVEKPSINVNEVKSSDPDFIDIDSEDKDPQLCSLYAEDIYRILRTAEVYVQFMRQIKICIVFIFLNRDTDICVGLLLTVFIA